MRLTRGCRAGGGVACSSLEYGGIRAATSRTPAPRLPLSLSLFLFPHHLSQRSPSPLLLVLVSSPRFPRERRFGPAIPSHPSARARPPGALSLFFSVSIRHRAVRSLPSRGYDAPSPSPSSPSCQRSRQ